MSGDGKRERDRDRERERVDFFCVCPASALNVTYFLYGGTLLGSLRSGDVLPWDDDLDLAMDWDHVDRVNTTIATMVGRPSCPTSDQTLNKLPTLSRESVLPNQQCTLINKLRTELPMQKFLLANHRLSMQIGAKPAKTCVQLVYILVFRLSFYFACHRWWLGVV